MVTTFSLFGFEHGNKGWAFQQMGLMPRRLKRIPGLKFFKLLGAGHGKGFSIRPDFSRYGLIAVWENENFAKDFYASSEVMNSYRLKAGEVWNCTLVHTKSHGKWDGANPFGENTVGSSIDSGIIAVLTRASIRKLKLLQFWKHVPDTSAAIANAPGLLASIGVGEWPIVRQATVSFWQSSAAMEKFAYHNQVHKNVITKTRNENWYKEELFARFQVKSSKGTWNSQDPLKSVLNQG